MLGTTTNLSVEARVQYDSTCFVKLFYEVMEVKASQWFHIFWSVSRFYKVGEPMETFDNTIR